MLNDDFNWAIYIIMKVLGLEKIEINPEDFDISKEDLPMYITYNSKTKKYVYTCGNVDSNSENISKEVPAYLFTFTVLVNYYGKEVEKELKIYGNDYQEAKNKISKILIGASSISITKWNVEEVLQ